MRSPFVQDASVAFPGFPVTCTCMGSLCFYQHLHRAYSGSLLGQHAQCRLKVKCRNTA